MMMSHFNKLYQHQKNATQWLIEHKQGGILCDNLGTGKSFSALAAIDTLKAYPLMVVRKKYKQLQWYYELERINRSIQNIVNFFTYEEVNDCNIRDHKAVIFDDIDSINIDANGIYTSYFANIDVMFGIAESFKKHSRYDKWFFLELFKVNKQFANSQEIFGREFCDPRQTHDCWEYHGKTNNEKFSKLMRDADIILKNDNLPINNLHIIRDTDEFIKEHGDNKILILDQDQVDSISESVQITDLPSSMSFEEFKEKKSKNSVFFAKYSSSFKYKFDNILFSQGYSLPNWDLKNVGQYFYTDTAVNVLDNKVWEQCCKMNDIQKMLDFLDNNAKFTDYHWSAISLCLANMSKNNESEIVSGFKETLPNYINIKSGSSPKQ